MPVKPKLKIRKLRASEVTFTVSVEQDDLEVRGNAMASDDPAFDKECEDEILANLNRGFIEAWCCILVKATWEGIEGFASLGGCSFEPGSGKHVDDQVQECIREHGLHTEALESLNASIQRQSEKALDLISRLKVVTRKR